MIVLANIDSTMLEIICGTIAACACFSVILTYIIFKDLRSLRYVELVFYVSINDFIGSVGISLGGQYNNTPGCWFQGISTSMNYLGKVVYEFLIFSFFLIASLYYWFNHIFICVLFVILFMFILSSPLPHFLASMFWITVISYQVWLVVHHRTIIKNMTFIHCICWSKFVVFSVL